MLGDYGNLALIRIKRPMFATVRAVATTGGKTRSYGCRPS